MVISIESGGKSPVGQGLSEKDLPLSNGLTRVLEFKKNIPDSHELPVAEERETQEVEQIVEVQETALEKYNRLYRELATCSFERVVLPTGRKGRDGRDIMTLPLIRDEEERRIFLEKTKEAAKLAIVLFHNQKE